MHLKKIELLGFKSFPGKTTVMFSDGVTAIVGPNGCGKTNILDALRWVLGEQKPTLLRGSKMDEVIFNGTHDMKPLGMCEVMLTIVNDRGILPTEYHELQVGRRLFRNGDSEYLINKVPCRLRDITDLFADTGMGARSYSVIQQDMIDSVISDKAEERRFLFEEAAGITKYKQRRKAALRKLEMTENDFLRLKDIYAEVKTRVNSLYRQHKKAERHIKLTDQIRDWEVYLASTRYKLLETERRNVRAQYDQLSDQKLQKETTLDTASAQLESNRKELIDIEHELIGLSDVIYTTTEKAHGTEREILVLKEKKTNACQLIDKNNAEIQALSTRKETLQRQRSEAESKFSQRSEEYKRLNNQLTEAQNAQAETDRELLNARRNREEVNKKLLNLEGRLSSERAEKDTLSEQENEFAGAIAEIDRQREQHLPHQQELLATIQSLLEQLDNATARKTDSETHQAELGRKMESLVETGEELNLQLSNLMASVEACEARRTLLKEMMLHYEGYESGAVAAMENRERWPGLTGTVAEIFIPTSGIETALESALGEIARFIVCKDRATAEQIIQYLKSEQKGRIGILVPNSGTINPVVKRPDIALDGVVGWLDEFVTVEDSHRPLMEAVLSRTIVFDAGQSPDEILERLPFGFSAVSTDGILYCKNLVAGGSDDRFPLFRRKEKITEQEKEIEELRHKIGDAREQRNQINVQLAALRAESGQLNASLETLSEEIEDLQHRLSESEFENRSFTSELERLQSERQQLKARLESTHNRQCSLVLNFDELAGQKESLVASLSQSGNRLEDYEKIAADAAEKVAGLLVATIEAKSRVEQTESDINHVDDILTEINQRLTTKDSEISRAGKDIRTADETLLALEAQLRTSFEERAQQTDKQGKIQAVQGEVLGRVSTSESNVKQLRREKDDAADRLHQIDIRLTTLNSEITNLVQKLREEHEIDISAITTNRPDEKISDEDAPEHLTAIKENLKNFGAVNLLALEEYEVASEREKFLRKQLDDLTAAQEDLKSTITRINRTARQLFNETIEKVRVNFQNLFVELFSGGEADIQLENPDDPLDSNIDITARPGGKKLLPITMLSGGERALTAISLLFSLYLVKPSPFCILDEIDAPLDDANCHRFLKIIHSFASQTQFITITHNKITMEAADNLYGVTMETPGVSTLVAVRFREPDDQSDGELIAVSSTEAVEDDLLPDSIRERISTTVNITPNEDT